MSATPIIAVANLHPNSLSPNIFIPLAMSHLPTGGWTMNSGEFAATSTPYFKKSRAPST